MNRLVLTLGAAAAILFGGTMIPTGANASPLGALGVQKALEDIELSQHAQAGWCFYFDGWNGPGFYRCGFRTRRGQGWHGHWDSRRHSSRESRRHSSRDSRRHSSRESRRHSSRDSRRHSTWESYRGRR